MVKQNQKTIERSGTFYWPGLLTGIYRQHSGCGKKLHLTDISDGSAGSAIYLITWAWSSGAKSQIAGGNLR